MPEVMLAGALEIASRAVQRVRRAQPFAWGIHDCCTFAADAVQAITGQDPAPAGLRAHRTEKQALRALRRHGGVVGIATDAMGPPAPVSLACVGDVVVVCGGVGVCVFG